VKVNGAVPVLVSVTVCWADAAPAAVDGKVRLVGETVATGAPALVPLRVIVCGELAALSVKVSVAEAEPIAVGEKMIEAVQEAPAATVVPQLLT